MLMFIRRREVEVSKKAALASIQYFHGRTYMGHHRDSYDYTFLLQNCKAAKSVRTVHAQIVIRCLDQNPFLATKLVGKYIGCSFLNMDDARKVFDGMSERDAFLWNMVIQGYANLGPSFEALNMYGKMRCSGVSANRYTFSFVLKACGALEDRKNGNAIHGHAVKSGFALELFVGNALIAYYAKCQEIESSSKMFDEIPQRDIVSWNSLISGYSSNGYVTEAINLFCALLDGQTSCKPDRATLLGILPACAQAAAIQVGFWIHCYIIKSGMEVDASLGSGLVSMYANCGRLHVARDVFDRIAGKNIVAWNAMIRCYGMHGHTNEALNMFSQLVQVGLRPDGIIFLCLLSACSHAGMVAQGRELFNKMEDYGVQKSEDHYACMVDLLGRAGFLEDAVEFIQMMPVQPGKGVYGALLGACRIHHNVELAEKAAEKLFVLDPENAGRYIILANMYEDSGRKKDAARLRKVLQEKNIRKLTGCSAIEIDCVHHTFGVKDETHPFSDQIFVTLDRLDRIMKEDDGATS